MIYVFNAHKVKLKSLRKTLKQKLSKLFLEGYFCK